MTKINDIKNKIASDKDFKEKLARSVKDYIQLENAIKHDKEELKNIEKYIQENLNIQPAIFKKIVKVSQKPKNKLSEEIEDLSDMNEISTEIVDQRVE